MTFIAPMTIDFRCGTTSLGVIGVAATRNGVCCVSFAESTAEFEGYLRKRFPGAALQAVRNGESALIDRVLDAIDAGTAAQDIALDAAGTEFQLAVWSELRRIPRGTTRTYAEVARNIGKPGAFRAVARACGANPLPIIVPCHRVVAADGSPGGYSGKGGVETKRRLLQREDVHLQGRSS